MSGGRGEVSRRLFFACWPDANLRAEIVKRRRLIEGLSPRRVPDHNLHLTLLFLGNQPAACVPSLLAAMDQVTTTAFELTLDRFGWFPGARVAWLGGHAPAAAQALVSRLSALCEQLGLQVDRRPFRPHVTLFRKVSGRPELPDPEMLVWPVREFALIESIPSRPYQVLRIQPFTL